MKCKSGLVVKLLVPRCVLVVLCNELVSVKTSPVCPMRARRSSSSMFTFKALVLATAGGESRNAEAIFSDK